MPAYYILCYCSKPTHSERFTVVKEHYDRSYVMLYVGRSLGLNRNSLDYFYYFNKNHNTLFAYITFTPSVELLACCQNSATAGEMHVAFFACCMLNSNCISNPLQHLIFRHQDTEMCPRVPDTWENNYFSQFTVRTT